MHVMFCMHALLPLHHILHQIDPQTYFSVVEQRRHCQFCALYRDGQCSYPTDYQGCGIHYYAPRPSTTSRRSSHQSNGSLTRTTTCRGCQCSSLETTTRPPTAYPTYQPSYTMYRPSYTTYRPSCTTSPFALRRCKQDHVGLKPVTES